VSNWSQVSRPDVIAAMAECDRLGPREFLSRYRFGRAKASSVWHDGHEYDSKAVLGVALLHATGRPATADDFRDGEGAATRLLTGMGFDVVVDQDLIEAEDRAAAERELSGQTETPAAATKPTTVRKRAATKKQPAAPKAVKKVPRPDPMTQHAQVCPTCYMAIPSTGICDNCG
jgi:hypothetical protein